MNTKELQEAASNYENDHIITPENFKAFYEGAQKLLSLYPLLEELCEARDKASSEPDCLSISQPDYLFFTTAANTTNQIRKVLDE